MIVTMTTMAHIIKMAVKDVVLRFTLVGVSVLEGGLVASGALLGLLVENNKQ